MHDFLQNLHDMHDFLQSCPNVHVFMQKLYDMHDFYATVGLAGCRISSECRGGVET